MMDEMIFKKAAIDAIEFGITYARAINKETGEVKKLFQEGNDELKKAVERVKELPAADAATVIRCKDCKYWREHKYAKETRRYIPFCGFNAIYTKADDFCSRGERREE